jgi:hypothetical protein
MDAKVAYGVWMCLIYSATPCIFSITGITMDQAAAICTINGSATLTFIFNFQLYNNLYLMIKLQRSVTHVSATVDMYLQVSATMFKLLLYLHVSANTHGQCFMFKIRELYPDVSASLTCSSLIIYCDLLTHVSATGTYMLLHVSATMACASCLIYCEL